MSDLSIVELAAAVNNKRGLLVSSRPGVPVEPHRYNSFADVMDRYTVLFESQLHHRIPETALAIAEISLALNMMAIAWGIDLQPLIIAAGESYLAGGRLSVERAKEIIGDSNGR